MEKAPRIVQLEEEVKKISPFLDSNGLVERDVVVDIMLSLTEKVGIKWPDILDDIKVSVNNDNDIVVKIKCTRLGDFNL